MPSDLYKYRALWILNADAKELARFVSQFVADAFGGNKKDVLRDTKQAIFELRGSALISIGEFLRRRTGICRHRALLFKIIIDHLIQSEVWRSFQITDGSTLRAALIRGTFRGREHAFNYVQFKPAASRAVTEIGIVDCMLRAGKIISTNPITQIATLRLTTEHRLFERFLLFARYGYGLDLFVITGTDY